MRICSIKIFFFLALCLSKTTIGHGQNLFRTTEGVIKFTSSAPLELIKATSEKCQGILNVDSGEFAFRVSVKTFDGFNNPLQKVHFYENYMEVSEFPQAIFRGNIIEDTHAIAEEKRKFRAKGILEIHGIVNERIIEVILYKKDGGFVFESQFIVPLEDHNIEIPNIVRQKIAEKIEVSVSGILQ